MWLLLDALTVLFLVAGVVALYYVAINPALASAEFVIARARGLSLWHALAGFRTKIASWGIMLVSGVLVAYDFLTPIAAGVDWTPITGKVPSWLWPIILFATAAVFRVLRKITDRPEGSA